MADFIDLAKPLQLTTPGTAPIAGLTVADTAALEAIESPWPGMFVYVQADGKTYRVTELKEVTVGVFTKMAVKSYEPVPDNAALAEAGARPATIALPVPGDADNDNVTLVVDFSADGEFTEEPVNYTRVKMADSYGKMRVFCNNSFEAVPGPSLGVPYYQATVEFTLDQELFPGYVAGNKYYARFCWVDASGNASDWRGFSFRTDVAIVAQEIPGVDNSLSVADEKSVFGTVSLDYADGEVQNLKLTANATLSRANVANVPFGEALIVNVATAGKTLTVTGAAGSYTCSENKTYVVVFSNFGTLNVVVTETV